MSQSIKIAEIISPATPFYRNDKSSVVPSSAAILEVEQFSSVYSSSLQHWRQVNVIVCLHMMQYASINTNKKNMELLQHLYYHKLPNSTLKYHPSIPKPSIDFIPALSSQWIPLAGGMTARKQEATAPSCREKPQKTWARSSFTHRDTSQAATRQIHYSKYSIHWYRVSTEIIRKMDS